MCVPRPRHPPRLNGSPDDPLPKFNPRPKAVMVIPIYHDSEIAQYPKITSSALAPPTLPPRVASRSPQPKHKRRLGLFRRASSYSPPPSSPTRTERRSRSRHRSLLHRRDHSVPPPAAVPVYTYPQTPVVIPERERRGRSRSRHRRRSSSAASPLVSSSYYPYTSPYSATLDKGDRARPPNDPLVTNPPAYQIQATHSSPLPPLHQSSTHYSPVTPTQPYGYYSQSHGHTHGRERPPNDPLATNAPGYQVQATQPQGGIVGGHGGLAGGEDAIPSANALPSVSSVHGGRPPTTYQSTAYGGGHHGGLGHGLGGGHAGSVGGALVTAAAAQNPALDEFVRQYLRVLPPNPSWCASRCRGVKKGVCIGINYVGQRDELRGCANDARHMREFLIQYYAFPPSNILLLTDDDSRNGKPTRKAMFEAMRWLVEGARRDDSLFFHYSGHGGQSRDASGREADDMDETIFPVDYKEAGDIIDDELYKALVDRLPAGCRLTAIFDSCHSGTVLDLPYIHSAHGRLRSIKHVSRRVRERGVAPSGDVICFSACKDDETSADTFTGGVAVGAMSNALVRSLSTFSLLPMGNAFSEQATLIHLAENNTNQTYEELLAHLREILIPEYNQKAQISCTHPLDLKSRFTL
ncbi:hypothetical protein NMY22_g5188 [Coprinellus aureogranulatus]|nr:hypothetical protein NMY22_g5188 [Coprinellus aureogranulatus]